MGIRRAIPVLAIEDPDQARAFYEGLLGFRVAMDEDGMLMFSSPSVPTTQVIASWPSATAVDPAVRDVDVSIEVDDVDAVYAATRAAGLEIVYPLTDEPWGIRRSFLRDPSGKTLNVASHVMRQPPASE